MTPEQAKEVLLRYRPGIDDGRDEEVAGALEEVRRVPELREWWHAHQQFQSVTRATFEQVTPPAELRERLISQSKVIEVSWWRRPATLAAAAAIAVLFVVLATMFFKPRPEDTLAVFRWRMIGNALRSYAMTINTNDMAQVRQHLASRNAPADYELPPKLSEVPLLGAGVMSWRDRRVSMVCFNSKTQGMLYLFIVDAASLKEAPAAPEFASVRNLSTVSWTNHGLTYVLAGHVPQDGLKSLL